MPGIYLHGLIGTSNDVDTVIKTKSKRDINRQIISETSLSNQLKLPNSKVSQLSQALGKLLETRVKQPAFQQVLHIADQCFIVLRIAPDRSEHVLTITNVSNQTCQVEIPLDQLQLDNSRSVIDSAPENNYWYDLIGNRGWKVEQRKISLVLQPYDVVWLVPYQELERNIENHG